MINHDSPVIRNLFTRRSIRAFKSDPIPQEDLDLMLKCLEAAPSAGNMQPWSFHVVRNQELKSELCKISFNQKPVEQAPVVFAICAVPEQSAAQYGELGAQFFCIQDTAAATQNLLLAAHELGYGSLWVGIVKEKEIVECLDLPKGHKPIALVAVGKADETPAPMERKGIDKVSRYID